VLHAGEEVSYESLGRLEKQANKFASAFLLPQASFSREVLGTSLGYFLTLKERWGVSIGAMVMRCKALGILSENQTSYLFRQMNAQGIRKSEPLDDTFAVCESHVLPEGVRMLLNNDVCGPADIEGALGLNLSDVEQICSLPPATLDRKVVSITLRSI
jgi:Zn-dependent peptidase ImmA (M78 family)